MTHSVLPATPWYLPGSQDVHEPASVPPLVAEYFPAAHATQFTPSPWYPALHVQLTSSSVDPASHDPDFSALVLHVLQAVHVSPLP